MRQFDDKYPEEMVNQAVQAVLKKKKAYDSPLSGKNDHYVPQLLLRKFTSTPGVSKKKQTKIWVLNKTTGVISEELIKETACKLNYETVVFDEYVKKNNLESQFPLIVDDIQIKKYTLSADEKRFFYKFYLLMFTRSPWVDECITAGIKQKYEQIALEQKGKLMRELIGNAVALDIESDRHALKRGLIDVLENGRLLPFLINDCDIRFQKTLVDLVVGDNPIIPKYEHGRSDRSHYGFGDKIFYFPLKPDLVAVVGSKKLLKQYRVGNNTTMPDSYVYKLNKLQYKYASYGVFANNKLSLEQIIL